MNTKKTFQLFSFILVLLIASCSHEPDLVSLAGHEVSFRIERGIDGEQFMLVGYRTQEKETNSNVRNEIERVAKESFAIAEDEKVSKLMVQAVSVQNESSDIESGKVFSMVWSNINGSWKITQDVN